MDPQLQGPPPMAPFGDHPTRTGQHRWGMSHQPTAVNELSTAQERHSQVSGPGWQVGRALSLCKRGDLCDKLRGEE